jgi:hypothetical protein
MKNLEIVKNIFEKLKIGQKLNISESDVLIEIVENYIKCDNLEFISRQILRYLNENNNPHTNLHSDGTYVEVLEGTKVFRTEEYIVD